LFVESGIHLPLGNHFQLAKGFVERDVCERENGWRRKWEKIQF